MRCLVSVDTISVIMMAFCSSLLSCRHALDHVFCNGFNQRNGNGISKLTIGLCITHDGFPPWFRESLQAGTLGRGQSSGISARLRNENFGAVFVIAGRECSGNPVKVRQAKAESISFGFVLGCVILKIFPKMIRKSILGINRLRFQNVAQFWMTGWNFGKIERNFQIASEADNKYALPVLWYCQLRVKNS